MSAAGEALVTLGDERALATFQDLKKKAAAFSQVVAIVSGYESRLRGKLNAAKTKS